MTTFPLRLTSTDDRLTAAIAAIRDDLALPQGFPAAVEHEAERVVAAHPLPEADLTAVPFITIDPEGSTDLDQAVQIERLGQGFLVRYAIADVPAFVEPLGAIDEETRLRGQTFYAPDGRIPLHPTVISENAASLLPDLERGAFVWRFELDGDGAVLDTTLSRARIRSVRQLSYLEAQREIDAGALETDPVRSTLLLLAELGPARRELERLRGGASLSRPEQIVESHDGHYTLERRSSLPVEQWNAQISLLTGMEAARIMIDGRVGILRTMPEPEPDTVDRFRRRTEALGHPWPTDMPYGEYLASLDPNEPLQLAITHAAGSLFRGAGYTAFDAELPEQVMQAAVAAPYAHTTAPLRRLVDRFVLVVCEALCADEAPPRWVRDALPALPKIMASSDSRASQLDSRSIAAVEAALLCDRVGEVFDASVISAKESRGIVQVLDPAVDAECTGALTPGQRVRVRLVEAEIATGRVLFELVA
ncbi:RNB domain-containing ribonuclease [Agreia sp. PsM10]|uniref:RNB domain-containing ribonuclease n=1 Tax=Agreia sp. PsM10 TaxID=3030533 RepID=UPI00263AF89A|nr:RNB domain-containing ribonuclease [Agreia sp. PsM10]MDN4641295.1 RNB domain-containing ribonuclease [Agreia sp. PsM10]